MLDGANLLLEEMLALLLREVLACLRLDAGFQLGQLCLFLDEPVQTVATRHDFLLLEQCLFLVVVEGQIACQKVNEVDRVVDVTDGESKFHPAVLIAVEHI